MPRASVAHALLGGWRACLLPEVRPGAVFQAVPDRTGSAVVDLHGVWAPRSPYGGDDLPQVLNVASPLVLRDVSHDEHSLGDLSEASGTRAWRVLSDRLADAERDPPRADGSGRDAARGRRGSGRDSRRRTCARLRPRQGLWLRSGEGQQAADDLGCCGARRTRQGASREVTRDARRGSTHLPLRAALVGDLYRRMAGLHTPRRARLSRASADSP